MKQYVQYDENGNIIAYVISDYSQPVCNNQVVLDNTIDVSNKKVDLNSLTLMDKGIAKPAVLTREKS